MCAVFLFLALCGALLSFVEHQHHQLWISGVQEKSGAELCITCDHTHALQQHVKQIAVPDKKTFLHHSATCGQKLDRVPFNVVVFDLVKSLR